MGLSVYKKVGNFHFCKRVSLKWSQSCLSKDIYIYIYFKILSIREPLSPLRLLLTLKYKFSQNM